MSQSRPSTRGRPGPSWPAVAACVAPLVLTDLTFFMRMVLAAIVVTGLSLLMGYSGQASLGQGAFVAAGALTVAVGTTRFELPPLVALLVAPLVAAAFAALVGVPLLRLHGHYLAFGTLALLLMVQAAMSTFDVLGGAFGISGIPPLGVGGRVFVGQLPYVYLALGCLGLVLLLSHRTVHSRFGRGIQALAGSQTAAESAGVPVNRSKVTIFALSAGYAGLAGGLSAFFTPYVSPDSFPALESFTYVIMAVVGGLGTDLRRSGRSRDRLGAPPGPQHGQQPARAAAHGGPDHAVRDVRRVADPGAALHAAGYRPDRGRRGRPGPGPLDDPRRPRDESGGDAVRTTATSRCSTSSSRSSWRSGRPSMTSS